MIQQTAPTRPALPPSGSAGQHTAASGDPAPPQQRALEQARAPAFCAAATTASSSARLSGWYRRRVAHSCVPLQLTSCASWGGGAPLALGRCQTVT